ncbi:HEAT repeat domain-containing protein [bacterium]|nr:HEAT repeat domain-containing protein [bacterium]
MRCIHLAPKREQRSLERAGVRGAAIRLHDENGEPVQIAHGVFCMPILKDFSTTFQWLRELRRWHGRPMVAATLSIPDSETVWVGRYGNNHQQMLASQAAGWIESHPSGSEMVIPRSLGPHALIHIREMPQLVGWTEIPEAERKTSCCCVACLPPGLPDLLPRLRGIYAAAIHELRRASGSQEAAQALAKMSLPLERARRRLSPRKILSQARSPHPLVRQNLADLLAHFRWADVHSTCLTLLEDEHEPVRESAAYSLWLLLGSRRTAQTLLNHSAAYQMLDPLQWETNPEALREALQCLTGSPFDAVKQRALEILAALQEST